MTQPDLIQLINGKSDSALLFRAQTGDLDAFADVVERYWKPIQTYCYKILGNTRDAEDAAQEVLLRVYLTLSRYDSSRPFAPWIFRIATHYCIDQLRKRKMLNLPFEEEQIWENPQSLATNPEAQLHNITRRDLIKSVLITLQAKDRKVVLLHHWYGYSYEEISQELSITTNAVKGRLHRARKKFTQIWNAKQSMADNFNHSCSRVQSYE